MTTINLCEVFGVTSSDELAEKFANEFAQKLQLASKEPLYVEPDITKLIGLSTGVTLIMAVEISAKITDAILMSYGIVQPASQTEVTE